MRHDSRRSIGFGITVVLTVATAIGVSRPARGDGAFPSAQSVLLPSDRPREIILATTFGLVFTEDDGATWRYTCETDKTTLGRNYVVGPSPDNRIYGVSSEGAPVSADGACTWAVGGGALVASGAEAAAFDVFPDRTDSALVFALAVPWAAADPVASVYRSRDGGLTYVGPLFTPPAGATSTGVESALSDPRTVYATWYERFAAHPWLARSSDGGDTWTLIDIGSGLGAAVPYLVAVDPTDPLRIYLRVVSPAGADVPFEALEITDDGGQTWSTPLILPGGRMTGFARQADGSLFVVGTVDGGSLLFRSDDDGRSFAGMPLGFQAGGLGERDGTLFISANNFVNGFALTSSDDGGRTWRPRLRFSDITGIKACVSSTCRADCEYLASLTLFSPTVCAQAPDAGAVDATTMDSGDCLPAAMDGCGCGVGSVRGVDGGGNGIVIVGLGFVVASLAMVMRSRRRSLARGAITSAKNGRAFGQN